MSTTDEVASYTRSHYLTLSGFCFIAKGHYRQDAVERERPQIVGLGETQRVQNSNGAEVVVFLCRGPSHNYGRNFANMQMYQCLTLRLKSLPPLTEFITVALIRTGLTFPLHLQRQGQGAKIADNVQ